MRISRLKNIDSALLYSSLLKHPVVKGAHYWTWTGRSNSVMAADTRNISGIENAHVLPKLPAHAKSIDVVGAGVFKTGGN
jgi:hypothetical protein